MMKVNFTDIPEELKKGIRIISQELKLEHSKDGITVDIKKTSGVTTAVLKNNTAVISYSEKIYFFRTLGIVIEKIRIGKTSFKISQTPQFEEMGVMFDVSRNAVLNLATIKSLLRKMALMGFNMVMLYTEDTYTLKNYPYFGYFRGRYTNEELKEVDEYAFSLGIEAVPCIQTIAHLASTLKWHYASDINDTDDILLVGEEKTYQLIENMIKTSRENFRSNRIHIGMDEAFKLGLGNYLNKNGYRKKSEIFSEHISKVTKITEKYNYKPMMYSDMFVTMSSKSSNCHDENASINENFFEKMPKDMSIVYWDYLGKDKKHFSKMLKMHKPFQRELFYAGGAWTFSGNVTDYRKALSSSHAALLACKEENVKNVYVTLWGDGGAETDFFGALVVLQLYAEHCYNKAVDFEMVKQRFKGCAGIDADTLLAISDLDMPKCPEKDRNPEINISYYALWQDILLGIMDKNISHINAMAHYENIFEKLTDIKDVTEEYHLLLERYICLCKVLTIKADIGIRIKKYYDEKNKTELKKVAESDLPLLALSVSELRKSHKALWMSHNKPFGWEVMDIRYGGLLMRIDTAEERINEYLSGYTDSIEELEQERLYYNDTEIGGMPLDNIYLPWAGFYTRLATMGNL